MKRHAETVAAVHWPRREAQPDPSSQPQKDQHTSFLDLHPPGRETVQVCCSELPPGLCSFYMQPQQINTPAVSATTRLLSLHKPACPSLGVLAPARGHKRAMAAAEPRMGGPSLASITRPSGTEGALQRQWLPRVGRIFKTGAQWPATSWRPHSTSLSESDKAAPPGGRAWGPTGPSGAGAGPWGACPDCPPSPAPPGWPRPRLATQSLRTIMVMMIWYWKYMGMSSGGPTAGRAGQRCSQASQPALPHPSRSGLRERGRGDQHTGLQLRLRQPARGPPGGLEAGNPLPRPHPGSRSTCLTLAPVSRLCGRPGGICTGWPLRPLSKRFTF